VIACCAVACSSGPAATSAPAGPATAPSQPAAAAATGLVDRLVADAAGAPLFLVAADDALVIRSDREVVHRIPLADLRDAAYHAELELVFAVAGDALTVVDLRERDPRPRPLVRGVPDAPVQIAGKTLVDIGGGGAPELLVLTWSAEPATSLELTLGEVINADTAEAIEQAAVVGADWLVAQLARQPATVALRREAARTSRGPTGTCEDEELCGKAVEFGASGWELYVVEHSCGDYCYTSCALFDPATGKVAEPGPAPSWADDVGDVAASCGPYYFDSGGTVFAASARICRTGGSCQPVAGPVIGMIGAGRLVAP
jgi:hypothetical protein